MGQGFRTADLTRVRDTADDFLPDTCTVRTVTKVVDTSGGRTETVSDVDDVPCRLGPAGGAERTAADRIRPGDKWVLTVAHDRAIEAGNRIVHNTVVYEIVSVHVQHSYRTVRRAMLVRQAG